MHKCTSIIINSFHLFQQNLFNKGFLVEEGGSLKSEWKQTWRGEWSSLSLCFSFHSSIFHSKIHKHPAFIMNRDKQGGGGQKFEVLSEHTFWMTPKFFPATKIYILTFNLTHFLVSLMGSFHFPQWKIFFPIHW